MMKQDKGCEFTRGRPFTLSHERKGQDKPTEARRDELAEGVCPECKGKGWRRRKVDSERYIIGPTTDTCPTCKGTGQKQPKTLAQCIKEATKDE